MHTRMSQRGFTLVELMIAMVLGLMLTAALLTMLTQARQSFREDESIAAMQDESRYAMQEISKDLSMAGFVGEVMAPEDITADTSLSIGEDCEAADGEPFAFNLRHSVTNDMTTLMAVDNITTATAVAQFACLSAAELVAGTDVVAIKRLAGSDATDAFDDNDVGIRENGTLGIMYARPIVDSAYVIAPYTERRYTPVVYFIRNYTDTVGDGIPSLCRKVLVFGSTANMQTECIAEGIENLQVEYGVDANGDGTVDSYITAPTQAQLERAISARIYLLSRAADDIRGYDDARTYRLSNATAYKPADDFRRRVHMTTVSIPNVRNRILLGS